MAGSNCSILGCSKSRNKNKGLGVFRIPPKGDEYSKKRRNVLEQIVTKESAVGNQLRELTEKDLCIFVTYTLEKIKSIVVSLKTYFLFLILIITKINKGFSLYGL